MWCLAQVLSLGPEAARAQRDLAVRQYLDEQLGRLVLKQDSKDKVMALAREVGARIWGTRGRVQDAKPLLQPCACMLTVLGRAANRPRVRHLIRRDPR